MILVSGSTVTQKSSYCQNLVLFVVAANASLFLILSIFNASLVS